MMDEKPVLVYTSAKSLSEGKKKHKRREQLANYVME